MGQRFMPHATALLVAPHAVAFGFETRAVAPRFAPRAFALSFGRICFLCLLTLLFSQRAAAQATPPVLLSEESSTRAISLESVGRTPEPYTPDSTVEWGADRRTRIELFAMNLALQPGEDASALSAGAEDFSGRRYDLRVEYVGPVPGFEWMTSIVVRLGDDMTDMGDVLVWVSYKGMASNRVRVGIGHVGGGPPDDFGAVPTPPRLVSGRVTIGGVAAAGVNVLVTGSQTLTLTTAPDGSYSFIAAPLADYTLTPQTPFIDFNPPSRTFVALDENPNGVDFDGARQTRSIFGRLRDDDGRELFNFSVTLTGQQGFTETTLTDDSGGFSFSGVPAGLGYTITPEGTNVGFVPLKIDQLANDLTLDIVGTRRKVSVVGQVTDYAGPVAGVSLQADGQGVGTTTDANGVYRLVLSAGLPYFIEVSHPDYTVDTPFLAFDDLETDQLINIAATPHFALSGRVTDASGKGVFGVNVNATGPQSATAYTHADGSYSIIVNAYGDYTVSPAKEQGYYSFAPQSRSVAGVKSARAVDTFTSALTETFSPSNVMEFDGTQMTVDYGMFWDESKTLGHFFWELWAEPGPNTSGGYMISDGWGGAHAVLFGFGFLDQSEPGHYQLSGNTWNGTGIVTFTSDEGPQVGEWGHYAVGWNGDYLMTYFDGVPVGRTKFDGQRKPGGSINGAGWLLIGGSDHSNFQGRIAEVRGYEASNPREGDGSDKSLPYAAFAPQTVFSPEGNFLSLYFRPGDPLTDLSKGYEGVPHTGIRHGTKFGTFNACNGCPFPQFVVDPTAPDFSNPSNPGQHPAPTPTPTAAPSGSLVFDSFSRANSTYMLGSTGGLGSTEAGSAGTRQWQTGVDKSKPQPFGILNGRAVVLANSAAVTWVEEGATDLDIRVDRRPRSFGTGQNTGVAFRVSDPSNYFFAYTSEGAQQSDPKTLTVGYYLGGARKVLAIVPELPNDPQNKWTTLRVLTYADGRIQVYVDTTLVFTALTPTLAGATGAGLYNDAAGLALTNRWDNFAILKAP